MPVGQHNVYAAAQPSALPDELKRILVELRTYNPKADEYGGKHIIPGWADRIEKVLSHYASAPVVKAIKIPDLPADCDRTEAHYKYQEAIREAGGSVEGD